MADFNDQYIIIVYRNIHIHPPCNKPSINHFVSFVYNFRNIRISIESCEYFTSNTVNEVVDVEKASSSSFKLKNYYNFYKKYFIAVFFFELNVSTLRLNNGV